jgi:hypothetical protein
MLGQLNYDSRAHISSKYYRSHNPDMSIEVAVRNFSLAAAQGLHSASCMLGFLKEYGCTEFPADHAEAVKLYEAAAAHGDRRALFRLALCHERGRGVPQNVDLAKDFFIRAREAGFDADEISWHLARLGPAPPPPAKPSRLNAVLGNLSCCFPTSIFTWLRATCPVIGPKVAARLWFLLLTCIFVPVIAGNIHHDYGFTQELHAAPRLLMMSPWLVAASLLARRTIRRILGASQLLDALHGLLHEYCGKDRLHALYCCLGPRILGAVFSELWRRSNPGSRSLSLAWTGPPYDLAWMGPPYDIFVFAAVFCNQCAACFDASLLYLCFLCSL